MSAAIASDSTARLQPAGSAGAPPALARRVLLDAVFLGGLADALLRDGFGFGLVVWMVAFAVTLTYLARSRGDRLRREQLAWLCTAILFAGWFAWRDSVALRFYDFVAMLGALAILGVTLARGSHVRTILGQRLRDLVQALGAIVKQVTGGVIALVFVDSAPGDFLQKWRGGRGSALVRASLLALPILLLFGLLLGSADPLFEKLLSLPMIDWGTIASHILVAGFFTWVVGGWMRGALVISRASAPWPDVVPFTLGRTEISVVLGGLVALFALFVGVQIGWLFGGEHLVQSTTGLSYAQYARHGFFELVWVSLLVLPLLLAVRAAIRQDDEPGLRRYRLLSVALLVLLGGIMTSALGRMALYVHYYGLSIDRLFASVFMGWLALVFVWLAVTVLRGGARDFAAGMIITGFMTLAALNAVNPEVLVARVNIARGASALSVIDSVGTNGQPNGGATSPIDYQYLTSRLDGDAVGVIVNALVAPPVAPAGVPMHVWEVRERCFAVRNLLRHWALAPGATGHARNADWRSLNMGAWRAERAIRQHETALRRVTCQDSTGEVPFGDRERRPALPGEQFQLLPSRNP